MLHQYEKLVLLALKDEKRALSVDEIAARTKLNKDSVMRACYWLKEKGIVDIHEKINKEYTLTIEGNRFLRDKFPEQRVLNMVKSGPIEIEKISPYSEEARIGIPWAVKNRWVSFIQNDGKKFIAITEEGKKALAHEYPYEYVLKNLEQKTSTDKKNPLLP